MSGMSKNVNTVLGKISPEEIGRTLMHEHFIFGYPGFAGDVTLGNSRRDLIEHALEKAIEIKALGIDTVIDATPNECGRDVEALKEISERSGLHIICSTGFFREAAGAPSYFTFRQELGYDIVEEIYEMFMKEITDGVADTGIKPGVIKLATGENSISEYETAFFKAAARAQKDTGTPIITHTEVGTMGPEQADLLLAEGGIANKISIGHMCGNKDINYHLEVLKRGVYDAFDRFAEENFFGGPSDPDRIRLMQELIKHGYLNRLLMSTDTVNSFWGRDVAFTGIFEPENAICMKKIPEEINPMMLKMGMLQTEIDQIQIGNIKELFK